MHTPLMGSGHDLWYNISGIPLKPPRSLVFGSPALATPEINEVIRTLKSGWIGTGPRAERFEKDFVKFKGGHHAVAVSSCSAALHLSLLASGIGPSDEVITSALTYCATVNAVIHAGATPVLVDVDPYTMNLDPARVEAALTRKTKVILPVHFAGRPCDMEALTRLARSRGLGLIEDCAHATEAMYKGRPTGTFGDFGCFSFYANKNVVTGEGGMILARRRKDAERVRILALQGIDRDAWRRQRAANRHYRVIAAGFKYNMPDLLAAIGIHQLRRIKASWSRRQGIWRRYNEGLRDLPLGLPIDPLPQTRHAYHLYTVLIDKKRSGIHRDGFRERLRARGIDTGVHYLSIPEHPYYRKKFGWKPEDFPHARRIGRQTVSLPLSPSMNDADVDSVITATRSAFAWRS